MVSLWLGLTAQFALEDVQAVLSILISFIAAASIFTLSRVCWKRSAARLIHGQDVQITALYYITSFADAMSISNFLLHGRFLRRRYWLLSLQAVVVMLLSAAAFTSGPLARASLRRGAAISSVRGYLASRAWNEMIDADGIWVQIKSSLESANFPTTQLLDFLPDLETSWTYQADEWNNTWHANCEYVSKTPLDMVIASSDNSLPFQEQMPALQDIIPTRFKGNDVSISGGSGGCVMTTAGIPQCMLFLYFTIQTPEEAAPMELTALAIHLDDPRLSNGAGFLEGPVAAASYTRANCQLKRTGAAAGDYFTAHPDTDEPYWPDDTFAAALETHYHNKYTSNVTNGLPVSPPDGGDMFRFFQAYQIAKDTQYGYPVTRKLSTQNSEVQISIFFFVFALVDCALVTSGSLVYLVFYLRSEKDEAHIPASRLDWMLQALREAEKGQKTLRSPGSMASTRINSKTTTASSASLTTIKLITALESACFRLGATSGELVLNGLAAGLTNSTRRSLSMQDEEQGSVRAQAPPSVISEVSPDSHQEKHSQQQQLSPRLSIPMFTRRRDCESRLLSQDDYRLLGINRLSLYGPENV